MERTSVTSESIRAIGYDADVEILEVEFNAGTVYQYSSVPKDEYKRLMSAESHKKYLNASIKGRYPYTKL